MKKELLVALFLSSLLAGRAVYAKDSEDVNIILNGKKVKLNTSPVIVSGRTMVPVREIMDALGGKVVWDKSNKSVTVKDEVNEIVLQIDSLSAVVNKKNDVLDVVPFIVEGRAMVPLRFLANSLDINVEWIGELNSVTLTEEEYFDTLPKDIVMGFTVSYYNNDKLSYTSVQSNKNINMIAVFNYSFDNMENIKIVDEPQQETIEYANNNNIIPLAVVHNIYNGNFNQELLHNMLVDTSKRQVLIHNILIMLTQNGYGGVNIDFENIKKSDKELFTLFITELKDVLARHGYITTVSVPAKTGDVHTSSWNYAFDYKALGNVADYIIIMAYDEHYISSQAGSIASINWVKDILEYSTKVVPSDKLILGLGLYGYDWSSGKGVAVPAKNCVKLANENNAKVEWDIVSKSPHFSYIKNNVYHEVWYEDNDSINEKLDLINKYNLHGVGFWRLGFEIGGILPTKK
ncbi:MAG: hypothetical protein J6Y29_01625 [Clostridiales bacterium]|nr:hypothetical protein [Clostridiales bacterium]